jgi:hypothetical protein
MDHNQPEPLMKLPNYIEHDTRQYHTKVLIDSAATLNFASQDFLTQNNLLAKCIRGPKIVVRIANEQRLSTTKRFFTYQYFAWSAPTCGGPGSRV